MLRRLELETFHREQEAREQRAWIKAREEAEARVVAREREKYATIRERMKQHMHRDELDTIARYQHSIGDRVIDRYPTHIPVLPIMSVASFTWRTLVWVWYGY
jgi:hypothetical protein